MKNNQGIFVYLKHPNFPRFSLVSRNNPWFRGRTSRKFYLIFQIILWLIAGLSSSCSSQSIDFEKQRIFEERFTIGMSRQETEIMLLKDLQDTEERSLKIISINVLDNNDFIVAYPVDIKKWGAPAYFFRYSPDNKLIVVYPLMP